MRRMNLNATVPPSPSGRATVAFQSDAGPFSGTVLTVGTTVTLYAGNRFDAIWAGLAIYINNKLYRIASVTGPTELILISAPPTDISIPTGYLVPINVSAYVTTPIQTQSTVSIEDDMSGYWRDAASYAVPIPYDIIFSLSGQPPANTIFPWIAFTRSVTFQGNFGGSRGKVLATPAATATYTVNKNGSSCGTIDIATSGVFTFATSGGAVVSVVAGDYFTLLTPNPADTTLSDVSITLAGAR